MEISAATAFTVKPNAYVDNYAAIKARTSSPGTTSSDTASSKLSISSAAQAMARNDQDVQSGSHDFTKMTPKQAWTVAQDLYDSGKINKQQHLALVSVELNQLASKSTAPTEAETARIKNTPINYVQYAQDRISFLESAGLTADPQSGYDSWKGLLAFMQSPNFSSAT